MHVIEQIQQQDAQEVKAVVQALTRLPAIFYEPIYIIIDEVAAVVVGEDGTPSS
jgi:hypothetical protein